MLRCQMKLAISALLILYLSAVYTKKFSTLSSFIALDNITITVTVGKNSTIVIINFFTMQVLQI